MTRFILAIAAGSVSPITLCSRAPSQKTGSLVTENADEALIALAVCQRLYRSRPSAAVVMAGLVPAIHAAPPEERVRYPCGLRQWLTVAKFFAPSARLRDARCAERRGWPGQARP